MRGICNIVVRKRLTMVLEMLEDGGEVLDALQCQEVTSKHPAEGPGLTPADLMTHTQHRVLIRSFIKAIFLMLYS